MESNSTTTPSGPTADPIDDRNLIDSVAAGDDDEDKTEDVNSDEDEAKDEPDVDETDTGTDDVPE